MGRVAELTKIEAEKRVGKWIQVRCVFPQVVNDIFFGTRQLMAIERDGLSPNQAAANGTLLFWLSVEARSHPGILFCPAIPDRLPPMYRVMCLMTDPDYAIFSEARAMLVSQAGQLHPVPAIANGQCLIGFCATYALSKVGKMAASPTAPLVLSQYPVNF